MLRHAASTNTFDAGQKFWLADDGTRKAEPSPPQEESEIEIRQSAGGGVEGDAVDGEDGF